jgi:hypothetical protein
LQNEQRRLENELVVQLYNINENEYDTKTSNFKSKSDDILNHFYNITRVEKEINKDFNIIFKLIKELINKQKENNQNNTKKKNYKNILVKNIKTSDNRLFIHINYIFSLSQKININNKIYGINLLQIKRDIFFSLIVDNINKHQNK